MDLYICMITHCNHYSFWCPNCPIFAQWEPLSCLLSPLYTVVLKSLFTFWRDVTKCLGQAHLAYFLPQTWSQPFLQGEESGILKVKNLPCAQEAHFLLDKGHSLWHGVHPALGFISCNYFFKYSELCHFPDKVFSAEWGLRACWFLWMPFHPVLLTQCKPRPFCDTFFTHSGRWLRPCHQFSNSQNVSLSICLLVGFPPWGLQTHLAQT